MESVAHTSNGQEKTGYRISLKEISAISGIAPDVILEIAQQKRSNDFSFDGANLFLKMESAPAIFSGATDKGI
jgi:hypothetical protein